MTIVASRLKTGELTFGGTAGTGGTSFACQASNVRVTPSYDDDGDRIETLCGDTILPGQRESWVLAGTSVQDFDDPDGFLSYCFEHRRDLVEFSWRANTTAAPTWSGEVLILAVEEGGDVNSQITTDWEFAISGEPTRAYPVVTP